MKFDWPFYFLFELFKQFVDLEDFILKLNLPLRLVSWRWGQLDDCFRKFWLYWEWFLKPILLQNQLCFVFFHKNTLYRQHINGFTTKYYLSDILNHFKTYLRSEKQKWSVYFRKCMSKISKISLKCLNRLTILTNRHNFSGFKNDIL